MSLLLDRELKVEESVKRIFSLVSDSGDLALRKLTNEFDGVDLEKFGVSPEEWIGLPKMDDFDQLIKRCIQRVTTFHERTQLNKFKYLSQAGAVIECRALPYESVGLYVPGGKAPLISTLIMLAVPALIAKVPRIVVCTPPNRSGSISPYILRACELMGISEIYKVGGAQAIASLAIGTDSIQKVEKIFGPGNEFVTEAKIQAQGRPWWRAVDMIAGPSELVAIVDEDQNYDRVATELMTQVEHGPTSWAKALTASPTAASAIDKILSKYLSQGLLEAETRLRIEIQTFLTRHDICEAARAYAPEHLALYVKDVTDWESCMAVAGAVYVGPQVSVVFGDYGIGPNHTLPTGGAARRASGLSVRDFQKTVTMVSSATPLNKSFIEDVIELARLEGMPLHAKAARDRLGESSEG